MREQDLEVWYRADLLDSIPAVHNVALSQAAAFVARILRSLEHILGGEIQRVRFLARQASAAIFLRQLG